MIVGLYQFTDQGWTLVQGAEPARPHLVIVFGSAEPAAMRGAVAALRAGFPEAQIAGCTTGGEMLSGELLEGSIVAAALQFERSHVHTHSIRIASRRESFAVGRRLGQAIAAPGLKGALVLAEGIDCDGSLLLSGIVDALGEDIPVFGGLAGDGMDFVVTRVAANGPFESGQTAIVGFFGAGIEIAHGTGTGWQAHRDIGTITNSAGGIIYEIDHQPALEVLRQAARLGSSISFHDLMTMPLWIADPGRPESGLIRSVVGIDENRGYLLMAGDVPRNGECSLMQAEPGDISAGAETAAAAVTSLKSPGLALCVSCVGRKEVLGRGAADEIQAVARRTGGVPQIGFYSYGEFGRPPGQQTRFLNQTMCVTMIGEKLR